MLNKLGPYLGVKDADPDSDSSASFEILKLAEARLIGKRAKKQNMAVTAVP